VHKHDWANRLKRQLNINVPLYQRRILLSRAYCFAIFRYKRRHATTTVVGDAFFVSLERRTMNKQNVVAVRFTDTEAAKLADLAEKRGIAPSLLLREMVRNAKADAQKAIIWSVTSHIETAAQHAQG